MIRVSISKYLELGMDMQEISSIFGLLESESSPKGGLVPSPPSKQIEEMTDGEKDWLKDTLKNARLLCEEIGLPQSIRWLDWLITDPPQTQREFKLLISAIRSEMEDRLFCCIPQHVGSYYDRDDLVSDEVLTAFPKASEEIRSAGTCMAVGRHTACVFHAMRAAELGLRAVGSGLNIKIKSGKPIEQAEWREILDGLSTAIRDLENLPNQTPNKEEDSHFYSEAAAQFRFFKNGWRVRVAHARATYDEPQAKEALDHVRSFFEILATRLKE